jgi:uncharacterized protein (DUF488 family)
MDDHQPPGPGERLFSIGHSNQSIGTFLNLLKQHAIQVLVDVRSRPYVKYATHFNREPLKAALAGTGIEYLFLGRELGGHPADAQFYDGEGHVLYERLAESPVFLEGIRRLENGARRRRVAIMCSEEDPASCHRRLLIARVLAARGIVLDHIRGNGRIQTEEELRLEATGGQGDLFADQEETASWKRSTQSVLPRKPRPSSSEH